MLWERVLRLVEGGIKKKEVGSECFKAVEAHVLLWLPLLLHNKHGLCFCWKKLRNPFFSHNWIMWNSKAVILYLVSCSLDESTESIHLYMSLKLIKYSVVQ